jgi:AbrB family looped-hinge helix DNA binding protein
MTTLTLTSKGQVTLGKSVRSHLGIKPGEKIEISLLPDGKGVIKAAKPLGTIEDFIGSLKGCTNKVASLEELNEAAAAGWAGEV